MERLTVNKNVSEMSMSELAHNSCYANDRKAMYRDYDTVIDARAFVRNLIKCRSLINDEDQVFHDDDALDEFMADCLTIDPRNEIGLIALFYRNLWAQADLYESLKRYEDLDEQGLLLKLPCKVGDTFYTIIESKIIHLRFDNCKKNPYVGGIDLYCTNVKNRCDYRWIHLPCKKIYDTQTEAEEALRKMKGSE